MQWLFIIVELINAGDIMIHHGIVHQLTGLTFMFVLTVVTQSDLMGNSIALGDDSMPLVIENINNSAHHKFFSYMNSTVYADGGNNAFHSKKVLATGLSHMFHANSTFLPENCDEHCVTRIRSQRVIEHLQARREEIRKYSANESRKYSVNDRISHVWLNRQKMVEWYVELPVASDPAGRQIVRLIPDTGSFFTWFQCKPCPVCFPQRTRIFDPVANRATFRYLRSGDDYCQRVQRTAVGDGANNAVCYYHAYYADATDSKGLVSEDTFRFWSMDGRQYIFVPRMRFGCGLYNAATIHTGMSGIMGLGRFQAVSISEQAFSHIGSSFSYCLPIVGSAENAGWLVLGDDAMPDPTQDPGYFSIPFPTGGDVDTYYLDAIDLHVNGYRVYIPPGIFDINPDGTGGLVIDSGTTMTSLMPEAYYPFRDSYRTAMRPILGDVQFGGKHGMDTCYDVTGRNVPQLPLPTMGFHLRDGQQLTFGRIASYFQYQSNRGRPMLCLFVTPEDTSPAKVSIFGGYQQMQMQMAFKYDPNRFIWSNDKC